MNQEQFGLIAICRRESLASWDSVGVKGKQGNFISNLDPPREREFELVAMPHAARLLRTALRLTCDRGLAEDLVQEVLLRAWRSFHQFEAGTNCKAWLFRIMLNLLSRRQKQLRSNPHILFLDENDS